MLPPLPGGGIVVSNEQEQVVVYEGPGSLLHDGTRVCAVTVLVWVNLPDGHGEDISSGTVTAVTSVGWP
jgi:hypothetical protein